MLIITLFFRSFAIHSIFNSVKNACVNKVLLKACTNEKCFLFSLFLLLLMFVSLYPIWWHVLMMTQLRRNHELREFQCKTIRYYVAPLVPRISFVCHWNVIILIVSICCWHNQSIDAVVVTPFIRIGFWWCYLIVMKWIRKRENVLLQLDDNCTPCTTT